MRDASTCRTYGRTNEHRARDRREDGDTHDRRPCTARCVSGVDAGTNVNAGGRKHTNARAHTDVADAMVENTCQMSDTPEEN